MSRVWDTLSGSQITSIYLEDYSEEHRMKLTYAYHSMLMYHNDECLVLMSSYSHEWRFAGRWDYIGAFDLNTGEKLTAGGIGPKRAIHSMVLTTDDTKLIVFGRRISIWDVNQKIPVSTKNPRMSII